MLNGAPELRRMLLTASSRASPGAPLPSSLTRQYRVGGSCRSSKAMPSRASSTSFALRCLCISRDNLAAMLPKPSSGSAADALLTQWSRRPEPSGATPSPSPVPKDVSSAEIEDLFTWGRAFVEYEANGDPLADDGLGFGLGSGDVDPPSMEDLFADEEERSSFAEAPSPSASRKSRGHEDALRVGPSSALLSAEFSPPPPRESTLTRIGKGEDNDATAAPMSAGRPPSTESDTIESLLQQQLFLSLSVDAEEESREKRIMEDGDTKDDAEDSINAGRALAHLSRPVSPAATTSEDSHAGASDSPDLEKENYNAAVALDADNASDGDLDSSAMARNDEEEEEEESMEAVLEEEAERMYRVALANLAKEGLQSRGSDEKKRTVSSDFTFFSKEAIATVVKSMSGEGEDGSGRTAAPTSEGLDGTAAAEFDDDAAIEAELESVGADMAVSSSVATGAMGRSKASKGEPPACERTP